MAIKKYTAVKDNVISTALKANLSSSAKASNMGSSDILEIFSIFGQANSASIEKSRVQSMDKLHQRYMIFLPTHYCNHGTRGMVLIWKSTETPARAIGYLEVRV